MSSTSHVRRIFGLLLLTAVAGFLGRQLLQPEGFGKFGHYRAGSLDDILGLELVHQEKEICRDCHREIYDVHQKDIHFGVQCEDCHGPGNLHVRYHEAADNSVTEAQATMPREYTLEGCLFCHRKLASRPVTFSQVDRREHYRFLNVTDYRTRCIDCHSPHEPLFLLKNVHEARVHPMIFECDHCHETAPERDHKEVPDHPVIFACRDCHRAIVEDFPGHEHSFLRCTACHLFYRVNETSGRLFRNAHRGFCLLCHEAKPFKDKKLVPQIVYSDHLAEMAQVTRRNAEDLVDDPTSCLRCHFDFAHDNRLLKRLRERER